MDSWLPGPRLEQKVKKVVIFRLARVNNQKVKNVKVEPGLSLPYGGELVSGPGLPE